jgi:hypothetical protein
MIPFRFRRSRLVIEALPDACLPKLISRPIRASRLPSSTSTPARAGRGAASPVRRSSPRVRIVDGGFGGRSMARPTLLTLLTLGDGGACPGCVTRVRLAERERARGRPSRVDDDCERSRARPSRPLRVIGGRVRSRALLRSIEAPRAFRSTEAPRDLGSTDAPRVLRSIDSPRVLLSTDAPRVLRSIDIPRDLLRERSF